MAESLIDYSSHKEPHKPKDKKSGQDKGGGEKSQHKESHRDDHPPKPKDSSSWKNKDKGKFKDNRGSKRAPSNKCFICDGDHWVRECPQRQALNSLLAKHREGCDTDKEDEGVQMGSLQILNVLQSPPKTEAKGLLYVDVSINGKASKAMIDTGASHNFVSLEEAKRLGLKALGGGGSIKAVNSAA